MTFKRPTPAGWAVLALGALCAVGFVDAAMAQTAAPAAAPASAPAPAPMPKASSAPKSSSAPSATPAPGGGPGMVWVNTASNVYHCQGSKYYGTTKAGAYMTEAAAKAKGAHADAGKPCS